jgi:hypothetical protein
MMSRPKAFLVRVLPVLVLVGALAAVPVAIAREGKSYGEPLSEGAPVKISALIADCDTYEGKTVKVEGLVTGVCKKRGCWMSLASDEEFQEIRIKVEDGVIVFPMEAKGRRATAEGVFHKYELTMEQTLRRREHHAEEHGESFDPASVTEPDVFYQIDATGAVVY